MFTRGMDVFFNLSRTHYMVLVENVLNKTYKNLSKKRCQSAAWKFYQIVLIILLSLHSCCSEDWHKPGCHKLGYERTITIDGCVAFNITYNACRGFCYSYALPTYPHGIESRKYPIVTSKAACCSINKTHDIQVEVACLGGIKKHLTIKAASSCMCSSCRK